jgi:hypothetical protein
MSLKNEAYSIDLGYLLFVVMTFLLGPCLWNFMTKKSLNDRLSHDVDSYGLLKEMKTQRKLNAAFFTINRPSDISYLETALNGRCAVAHGYFDQTSNEWSPYLMSWVEVLKMIDYKDAACTVKSIHDDLISGEFKALDIIIGCYPTPDFVVNETNKNVLSTDLTGAEYLRTIRLQIKLFQCMTKILGPALRSESLSKKGIPRTDSEIDCQNLLDDLMEEWLQNTRHPLMLNIVKHLETAKDGRNAVCHANLNSISADWETYLTSWEEVCRIISDMNAANEIKNFHSDLKDSIDKPLTGSVLSSSIKKSVRRQTMRIKLSKKR